MKGEYEKKKRTMIAARHPFIRAEVGKEPVD